jgi:ubiquinone biosynthesis protein COQ9
MTQPPSGILRRRWLAELLPDVAFEGWTDAAARAAAVRAGLTQGERALAAPQGVIDLIDGFFDDAQTAAQAALADTRMDTLRVPDRIKAGVLAWLAALEPNREAVRRAASRGFLPWSAGPALQRSWKVADMIWTAAGDQSEDYNRYSKRGLLAAVLPAIVFYWADHPAPEDLDAFIARRLANVSGVGQRAGRIVKPVLERFGKR